MDSTAELAKRFACRWTATPAKLEQTERGISDFPPATPTELTARTSAQRFMQRCETTRQSFVRATCSRAGRSSLY